MIVPGRYRHNGSFDVAVTRLCANALALSTSSSSYSGGALQARRRVRLKRKSKRRTGRCERAPSHKIGDCGKLERPLTDPRERSIEVGDEACAESGPLTFVPSRRRLDIGLGKCPNDESPSDRPLAAAIDFLAESLLHGLPAVAGVWIRFEILQTLLDGCPVPLRNRHCLRSRGDAIPQRLQVVDLLLDRQVVETGRRQRDWCGHEASCKSLFSIARVVRCLCLRRAPLHSCKYRWLHASATKFRGSRTSRVTTVGQRVGPIVPPCKWLSISSSPTCVLRQADRRCSDRPLCCSSSPPVLFRVPRRSHSGTAAFA